MILQRQRTDAPAGGREDGIAERGSERRDRRLADPAQVARMPRDLPVYVAVGSKDPVNGGLTLLWALVDRYRAAGLSDVTVRVYDGGRHEILNEINRAEVID